MTAGTSRARAVSAHTRTVLSEGWELCATAPGALAEPTDLARVTAWTPALVPGTAASCLRAAGAFDLEDSTRPLRRFDAEDFWFRTRFVAPERATGDEIALCFGGIATFADVWIDGEHAIASDDMFLAHEIPILAAGMHEIAVVCRSLDAKLTGRRPRPHWRVPMVENQQLRFARTTLLGRTPGWSPPVAAVGPYRPVWLEHRRGLAVEDVRLEAQLDGADGWVEISCRLRGLGKELGAIELHLRRGAAQFAARLVPSEDGRFTAHLRVADVDRWWPHTHGEPALYEASLAVATGGGDDIRIDLGAIGFRDLRVVSGGGGFEVQIDKTKVFCRGAVWTPLDPVSLGSEPAALARAFDQVTRAGMNMLRVSGAIGYEDDAFLDLCDARGVLLWQDFAFANFDYPDHDPGFCETVTAEVRQELGRLAGRPALAVLCGSSEQEQQAAMWGAPRARWSPRLTHEILPALCAELAPGVMYWPSSAHGGDFPHEAARGTTSYYGVGAYLRPLEDARRAEVAFASECLAFANVPGPLGLPGGPGAKVHHPAWKARAPRDLGAGWDFEDVRDHYLATLFGEDPLRLRYADHDRYLVLSRVVSGEVMAAVFSEWRRRRSPTGGGLVWFLRDLWAGAGWGLIESSGAPKAAYAYLRRALAPTAIAISDEGVNGLVLHVAHDGPAPLDGEIELALFRGGETRVGQAKTPIAVAARSAIEVPAASLLDGFMDLSNAYRFGPAAADLVVARLAVDGAVVSEAFYFPLGLSSRREGDLGLTASAIARDDGDADLLIRTRRFAQSIAIDVRGFAPDDDHLHLAPGSDRTVRLRRIDPAAKLQGAVQPLNAESRTVIAVTT